MKSFLRHYLIGLYNRMDEHHLFLMAGGLAFSLFTCLVPFALVAMAVLGGVLEAGAVQEQVATLIGALVPYESQAAPVREFVLTCAREFALHKGAYGMAGGVGLLFAASGLFSSMRTILNTVYRVEENKTEIVGKIRDFGMVFLVLCFFLVSIVALPVLEAAAESTPLGLVLQRLRPGHGFYALASLAGMFVAFGALYALIPYGRRGAGAVAVSAAAAVLLWEGARQAFGFYIGHFATIERIYGAYVLVVLPAFWIYYSSVAFIAGAEIGQLYRERRAALASRPGRSAE